MMVEKTDYMTAGIYIGMKTCTPYMKRFVYKIREDGLAMFNLKKIDERLKVIADFLFNYKKVLIVSRKENGRQAITAFAEAVGAKAVAGRFYPGTLTNPSYRKFYEPDIVFVIDPLIDEQAMKEARKKRIPIISMCNTFNAARNVDLILPINNNGKKSLALALWIIAREMQKKQGKIKKDAEFKPTLKDFGDE
ncbi:MAG: 30S ribosomal protein S2 [Candidatus Aenigmarchaeota archaeon]